MSDHRLSPKSQRHRQDLRNLPSNLPLYWAAFIDTERDIQQRRHLQRQREIDYPNVLSNFDPFLSDQLLGYTVPYEYFQLFFALHGKSNSGSNLLNEELDILDPWRIVRQFHLPYYGPKTYAMSLENGPNYPIFLAIWTNTQMHLDMHWLKYDPDWRNQLRQLYEQIVQYLIENGIPNINYKEQLFSQFTSQTFHTIDILNYLAFDIRKMLDLYFEALDMIVRC